MSLRRVARWRAGLTLAAICAAQIGVAAGTHHFACTMPPHDCPAPAMSRCCCAAGDEAATRTGPVAPIVRVVPAQSSIPAPLACPAASFPIAPDRAIARALGTPPDFPILLANLRL
jgi:hypothetical protein